MMSRSLIYSAGLDGLTARVARKVMADKAMIVPFADFTDFLTDLLGLYYHPVARLIGAGQVEPEVAQAADRAEITLTEQLGVSPFAGDLESVLASVVSPHDVIYVANPNRITGANFSVADLEAMARAVPKGMLIVDEYYFDYWGISALPLLDVLSNVVVLRSFTASFSINSSDAGFAVSNPSTIERLKHAHQGKRISLTIQKTMLATLTNAEAMSNRLQEVHDESLRLATSLNKLGVQCRICATDFLLIRVADPKSAGNHLAAFNIPIENLDGYPQMKNYIRYRIQSYNSNDKLINAFGKMPEGYYRMRKSDPRATTVRRGAPDESEGEKPSDSGVSLNADSVTDRSRGAKPSRKEETVS